MEHHLLIISSCDEWKEASTTASQLDIQRLRICKHMDFFSCDIACALKAQRIFLHDYNLLGGTYEGQVTTTPHSTKEMGPAAKRRGIVSNWHKL